MTVDLHGDEGNFRNRNERGVVVRLLGRLVSADLGCNVIEGPDTVIRNENII